MKKIIWLPYMKQFNALFGKWLLTIGIIDLRRMQELQEGGQDLNDISKKIHQDSGCKCKGVK